MAEETNIPWKELGALVAGIGEGAGGGGRNVSQNVQTSNSAHTVLSTATNISVSSPGGTVGPATADPTLYAPNNMSQPVSQSNQPGGTIPGFLTPSTLNPITGGVTPAKVQAAQGFFDNDMLLLIGGAVLLFSMMGQGKKA